MTQPPAGSPAPPLLLYVVKQLELATRAQLDALLRPSGITALQYTALSVLVRRPAMSSADLARASFVSAQSTADLVGALERRGMIERQVDPDNRRRMMIRLTEAGRTFLDEYEPLVAQVEERMLQQLDRGQRDALRGYLNSCRRSLASVEPVERTS
ncbi:MarR family winged helix-turn-helix transcriptional regulator [Blastococcus sp. LR1]|uniref:MarR family winged helix-turn-helix transcriptional regulator n=1 Tax=Blastococcus sp. LR1 TaxID=2877000 RepID=UPI001CCB90AA|nr:MarR family transcriptional regulator [Blastococcus sp. LR1]MCA0145083.1 MarR family transcriptional regulator [Blastococcus sp. LR1]